jgi:hypothetical protein
MRAVLVVVANILSEPAFQVAFVNCNEAGFAEHSRIISITSNVAVHNCRSKKIHLSADLSSLRCSDT